MGNLIAKTNGEIASFWSPKKNTEITSLKVHFSPKQDGTGDPSIENVRDIYGQFGINTYCFAENLITFIPTTTTSYGVLWSVNNNGIVEYNGSPTSYAGVNPGRVYLSGQKQLVGKILGNDENISFNTLWVYDANDQRIASITTNWEISTWTKYAIADLSDYPTAHYAVISLKRTYNPTYMHGKCYPVVTDSIEKMDKLINQRTSFHLNSKNMFKVESTAKYFKAGVMSLRNEKAYFYGIPTATGEFSIGTMQLPNGGKITVSSDLSSCSNLQWGQCPLFNTSGSVVAVFGSGNGTNNFTIDLDQYPTATKLELRASIITANTEISGSTWFMVESGNTATEYEPYDKEIFGGYVDLITGELTSTYGYKKIIGNESWYISSAINGYCAHRPTLLNIVPPFDDDEYKSVFSNKLKGVAKWATAEYECTINKTGHFYFGAPEELSTSNAVNAWIQEIGGIDIVYPLTEPITYQLTPQQVETLIGQNYFYSNADYIEIEYKYVEAPEIITLKKRIIQNEPHLINGVENFVTDLKSPLKSLKILFEPKQEGSGDAAPDNIRNIIGYTGTNIWKTGKNICHITGYSATTTNDPSPQTYRSISNNYGTTINATSPNDYVTVTQSNADETISHYHYRNGYITIQTDSLILGEHYNFSFKVSNILSNPLNVSLSSLHIANPYGSHATNPTVTGNRVIFSNYWHRQSDTALNRNELCIYMSGMSCTFSEFMITEVDEEDQTYEPYIGENIPVSWSSLGTQYGGYVDLVKGELVAEWAMMQKPWNEWVLHATQTNTVRKYIDYPVEVYHNGERGYKSYCNIVPVSYSWSENDNPHYYHSSHTRAYVWLPIGYDDTVNVQVLGKLIEPIHYSLTPQQILTLRGTNNIFSKDGPVETQYWTHINIIPKRKIVVWNQWMKPLNSTNYRPYSTNPYTQVTFDTDNNIATVEWLEKQIGYTTSIIPSYNIPIHEGDVLYESHMINPSVDGLNWGVEFAGGIQLNWGTCPANTWTRIPYIRTSIRTQNTRLYVPNLKTPASSYDPVGLTCQTKSLYLINLTTMFGAGNEPTDVNEFERICAINGIDLTKHQPYDEGTQFSWIID